MNRGALVDAETQEAIIANGDKIIKAIREDIQTLKDDLKSNTMLMINPINNDIERLNNDIAEMREKDIKRIEKIAEIEQRISALEGNRTGRDTQEERSNRRQEINYLPISIGISTVSIVGSIVFALYKG